MKGASRLEEFKQLLVDKTPEEIVEDVVFTRAPYVFRDEPSSMGTLRQHVVDRLQPYSDSISESDCCLVGSAQAGFSMAPDSFPNLFSLDSDIDVAIVNPELFDKIWLTILRWNYADPRRRRLVSPNSEWAQERREDIYWGWFRPDYMKWAGLWRLSQLTFLREIRTAWFNTFRELGLYSEFSGRDVHGRLYRSWEHALEYHVDGIKKIAKSLEKREE